MERVGGGGVRGKRRGDWWREQEGEWGGEETAVEGGGEVMARRGGEGGRRGPFGHI